MKNIISKLSILLAISPMAFGAVKPTSPAWQSGNSLASGVVRYWYVGTSLTTITDYSPSAHNLTFTGTPALTTAPGGVGNEYATDGTQLATGTDTGLPSGASAFTAAAWVKTSASMTTSDVAIFDYGTGATAQRALIDISSYTTFTANSFTFQGTGGLYFLSAPSAINDGAWHRVVVTYDGTTLSLYTDGALVASRTMTLNITLTGSLLFIGEPGLPANSWIGSIGDGVIWNRALSSGEVSSDYSDPWQEVRPSGAALAVGTVSKVGYSGLTTVSLSATSATGGTPSYTYQWQRAVHGGSFSNVGTNSTTLNDTGLSAGTNYDYKITVTDSLSATSTSSVLTVITLFPVDNANVAFTPGAWYVSGASPAAYAATNRAGSEMRFGFTGTSAVVVTDLTNVVTPANIAVSSILDGGARSSSALTSPIIIGSSLGSGTHSVRLLDIGQSSAANCWNVNGVTPDYVVKVIGIQVDPLSSLSTPGAVPTEKSLFIGDSITAAYQGSPTLGASDSFYSYANYVASGLNSEPSLSGFSSAGWTVTAGGSNVPPFASFYGNYWNGQARTLTNVFKRVVINLGTNDGSSYGSTVASGLSAIRTSLGSSTKVYVLVPFGGNGRAAIGAGFTSYGGTITPHSLAGTGTYSTASNDANTYLVDLGTNGQTGLGSGASNESVDGTHPNTIDHARLASMLVQAIQKIESPTTAGGSFAFSQ